MKPCFGKDMNCTQGKEALVDLMVALPHSFSLIKHFPMLGKVTLLNHGMPSFSSTFVRSCLTVLSYRIETFKPTTSSLITDQRYMRWPMTRMAMKTVM